MIVDTTLYSNEAAPSGNDALKMQSTSGSGTNPMDTWDRDMREIMRKENKPSHAPAMENLVQTRKRQYEIVQQLSAMLSMLNGEPIPDAAAQEWRGLVDLTEQITAANNDIARLVEECRKLIGA